MFKNKISKWNIVYLVVFTIIFCGLFVSLFSYIKRMPILPLGYMVGLMVVLIIGFALGLLLSISKKVICKIVGIILILVTLVSQAIGIYFMANSVKAMDVIANQTTETTTFGIYALKDSGISSVEELEGKKVGLGNDFSSDELLDEVDTYNFDLAKYETQNATVDALLSKECEGAILNTAFVSLLEESDLGEAFDNQVQLLDTIDITKIIELEEPISLDEPFILYISGKDVWGHISVTSRSDVNILAVVNPGTKHILLVSTPRDYYVPLSISNGVKDKLTHSGIYGIDVSKDTMEMIYDIDIDHYVNVNFSGFEGLIDAMGGITVWSDYDFDVENIGHFSKGDNQLTGLQALAFVRERHSFASGDRQRGENQMNVIQSVIQKMSSKETLLNYADILEECDGTFATDMSSDEIAQFVSFQLKNPGDWNIEKISVSGEGAHEHVYSLSKPCYVMIPNEDDIAYAKQKIQDIFSEK